MLRTPPIHHSDQYIDQYAPKVIIYSGHLHNKHNNVNMIQILISTQNLPFTVCMKKNKKPNNIISVSKIH